MNHLSIPHILHTYLTSSDRNPWYEHNVFLNHTLYSNLTNIFIIHYSVPANSQPFIMAENAPPQAHTTSSAPNADPSRGLPYYEKLRRDLRETLQKKRILDKNLVWNNFLPFEKEVYQYPRYL